MSRRFAFFVLLILLLSTTAAQAAVFDESVEDALRAASPSDTLRIYVTLADRVDLAAFSAEMDARRLTRAQRHYEVVTELQNKAAETQAPLLWALAAAHADVRRVKPFWIANAVAFEASPAFVENLRRRGDILTVYIDEPIELIEPVRVSSPVPAEAVAGVAPGIATARAPELWAMGIDGTGALACDQDTGADGAHPAFADRWRGLDPGVDPSAAWFDPVGSETFPTDSGSHGTHTLGTMLGDDHAGHRVGMAPGAKWIGAKTIDVPGGNIYSDAVAAFQWAADPDGNPATIDDVPDVVNNSWGIPMSACRQDFWNAIDAAEAAGVIVIFAAGNEGPFPQSLRSPANRIASAFNVFAVGALQQGGTQIAGFSSRGPSRCDHQTIKPEISAVGVAVLSSTPGNNYGTMDGTSMASPHVSGAVLLLRGAFPEASVDDVKMALYESSVDVGPAGEDNAYGKGRLDVVAAYWWLLGYLVDSNGTVNLDGGMYSCRADVQITVADEDLSGSVQVNIVSDSETAPESVTLTEGDIDGIFTGSIVLAPGAPSHDGVLQVSDGDEITVTYVDANDGQGHTNVTKTDAALVDCVPPAFAGLTGLTALVNEVELTWDLATDAGPVVYRVYRADSSGAQDFDDPIYTAAGSPFLDPNAPNGTEWFYVVRSADELGNEDDNAVELSGEPVGPDRIFWDNFDIGSIGEFTIVNGGAGDNTWTDENPGARASAAWTGRFAVADKSAAGEFQNMDEQLVTPPLDCSHHEDVTIGFSHDFQRGGWERAEVDWSYDGATWTKIVGYSQSASGAMEYQVPEADLHEQVYFRFHYYQAGLTAEYWGVDDVEVTGTRSTAPPITTTTTTSTTTSTTTTTLPADDDSGDDDTAPDDTVDDADDSADDSADDATDDVADDTADDSADDATGDDDDDSGACGC